MFVQGPGQKSVEKHRIKNFAKLPNHLPLLTMNTAATLLPLKSFQRGKAWQSRKIDGSMSELKPLDHGYCVDIEFDYYAKMSRLVK